jgi:hypothetical protein
MIVNKNSRKLFLCLFFVISPVWADEDVFRHPLMPQTMITFNAACAELAKKPIVKGNFVQEKYLSRFNRSLISSGNFIIAAGQGMVWDTLLPFPSTMILGNDFIVQSRAGGQRSVLSAQGNETFTQLADVIGTVFSGQNQGLLKNFEVCFLGSASNWDMGLLPRDSIIASFAMKITISGDSAIRSIRIFEQNGDTITYTLSDHSFPTELNDHEKAFF